MKLITIVSVLFGHHHYNYTYARIIILISFLLLVDEQVFVSSFSIDSNSVSNNKVTIPVLYDSTNHYHRDLNYHPEQPARIDACVKKLIQFQQDKKEHDHNNDVSVTLIDFATQEQSTSSPLLASSNYFRHAPFSNEELNYAETLLIQAHSEEHVQGLATRCRISRQRRIDEGRHPLGFVGHIDDDTYLTTESYDVCLRATAAWIHCVDLVTTNNGDDQKTKSSSSSSSIATSMALTRPPGHHATSTLSNGFCIFNFAAAAAIHAIKKSSLSNYKVSILDWDVHYGQGVADIITNYPNIRYVSMHQTPSFPYQGERTEITGKYTNIFTVPLPPDSTWTCGYQYVFEEKVLPFLFDCVDDNTVSSLSSWEPDLVIVCAGYDALLSDELASCGLTATDYGKMTLLLREKIIHLNQQRKNSSNHNYTPKNKEKKQPIGIMFGLEGGYQLKEKVPGGNLADALLETLKAFLA